MTYQPGDLWELSERGIGFTKQDGNLPQVGQAYPLSAALVIARTHMLSLNEFQMLH